MVFIESLMTILSPLMYSNLTFLPDFARASGQGYGAALPRPPAAGAAPGTGGTPPAGVIAFSVRGFANHCSTTSLFITLVTTVIGLGPSANNVLNPAT